MVSFLFDISNKIRYFYLVYKTKMTKFILYTKQNHYIFHKRIEQLFITGEHIILARERLIDILHLKIVQNKWRNRLFHRFCVILHTK